MFPSNLYIENKAYALEYPGYSLYKIKDWGDPYMQSIGYSAFTRGNVGQFQVVSPYIFDRNMIWCGALSSNSNWSYLKRADIFKIANHQLLDFGYEWGLSEQEIISLLDTVLPDGYSLKQKMGWLIWETGVWGSIMRSDGNWWDYKKREDGTYVYDTNGNKIPVDIKMIAIYFGGQKVMASDEVKLLKGQLMRRLITFKRSDLGKHYDTHPFLMQRVTVASTPNNVYGEDPKGKIYCPVALGSDFRFYTSTFVPDSYWMPDNQLIKL